MVCLLDSLEELRNLRIRSPCRTAASGDGAECPYRVERETAGDSGIAAAAGARSAAGVSSPRRQSASSFFSMYMKWASSTSLRTWSLRLMLVKWVWTVLTLTPSRAAISFTL